MNRGKKIDSSSYGNNSGSEGHYTARNFSICSTLGTNEMAERVIPPESEILVGLDMENPMEQKNNVKVCIISTPDPHFLHHMFDFLYGQQSNF